jgi:Ni2+-binding GTPase involved in maturation of urease and hydrogenase
MSTPRLILVGGFLGAGKTTLLVRAAELLRKEGLSVALITNDQDQGLVDTLFGESNRIPTGEVAGGCFCCRFSDFMSAAEKLARYQPDIIFAEPVGSCVDLSATILQPLKAYHSSEYSVAPLTVLVDPHMATRVFGGQANASVDYLYRKQIAEADILCVTKVDQFAALPALPMPIDFQLSAVSGQGVSEWLDEVRNGSREVGKRLLEVNYQQYAEAEAALGWVNVQARVVMRRAETPMNVVLALMRSVSERLSGAEIGLAHLKAFDQCHGGFVKVSLCRYEDELRPEGNPTAPAEFEHQIVVNLRAIGEPKQLEAIIQDAIAKLDGNVVIHHAGAFRPAPPKPEYRFSQVV